MLIKSILFETGSHWSDETILNGRGFFQLKANPATFAIEAVKNSDTGIYRCRVDFQKNPTRNSKFNLTVIIPPENILMLDDKGAHIPHYILGPYNEGANVELTCVATGGRPQPSLTWWRGENQLLDDSYTVTNEKKVKNVLLLEKLQRHHLHTVLACQASNNNVTTPIRSAVTLNMNPPTITWWKGSVLMRNSTDTTSQDANTTISMLKFTPTIDDSGKYLSCRGEQPLIPDSGLESGWKLDIHHVPIVSLELGSNLNSTTIREGADVYFECNIKSNPWVYKVNWNHNGKPLYNNVLAGIIVANQSLVLQNVTRARSGSYTCNGINNEGGGESNTVLLDIKYAPLCRPGQIQVYNIARHETAKIVCELESNPSHDVNFTWKFNTSIAETTDLPASLIAIERSKSVAHYTPTNEQDYGTLLCWGTNDIGTQSEPCIFNINPAGFDGGLPQLFEVEVFYARTKNLVLNQSSKQPFFELKGLRSDYGYDIVLTAKNAKGKSAETILHMYTLNGAEKHTDEFPSLDFLLPYTGNSLQTKLLLGAVAGLVFGILLILIAFMVILRLKRKRVDNGAPDNDQTDTSGATEQSCEATLRGGLSGSVDSLEKNPDIIPQAGEAPIKSYGSRKPTIAQLSTQFNTPNAVYLSRYYNMAVMKDPKERKFSLQPKPTDLLLKSTPPAISHLLSPTYPTDVESLNTATYSNHSPSRTVSSTTCAVSPSSTIVDETFEPSFLLRETDKMESYQSMMSRRQRGEKRPIPNEQKEKYFERRKRNNEAAKKSRDARKIREDRIAFQAAVLEQENAILRAQVVSLREENTTLRHLLCTRGTNISL